MALKNIKLIDESNNIIFDNKIICMPVHEKAIKEICIKHYNDPEPCFIHKSAAVNFLLYKLVAYIEEISSKESDVLWESIPKNITDAINIKENIYKVVIS